jgi:thiol-disulfide isomerase/thioredoxin
MKRSVVLVLALLFVFPLLHVQRAYGRQSAGPTWNAAAPELTLELLNAPSGTKATLSALKGRAVVLEFWATWCPPCVAQIPHLNSLVERFKDAPVAFISISDEELPVVAAFTRAHPISGLVALDKGSVTFMRYGIYWRPQTAFIDKDGVLRGLMHPRDVTESDIQDLLAGSFKPKASSDPTPLIGTEPNRPLPLVEIVVRPAMSQSDVGVSPGFVRARGNRWEAWGVDIRALVSRTYDVPLQRLIVSESVPTAAYDVAIMMPDETTATQAGVVRHLLENAFRLNVRHESREIDVLVLGVAPAGVTFKPTVKGRSVGSVARIAQGILNRVVVDETGLSDTYDYVMPYPRDEQQLRASIEALGLTLTSARRVVDMVVADQIRR